MFAINKVWYIILLSLFTVSEGSKLSGGIGFFPSLLSKNKRNVMKRTNENNGTFNELAIVPRNPLFDTKTSSLRGGAALNPFPAGYNPFGYSLTDLGKTYLEFEGSLESDIGKFLSTMKSGKRKSKDTMKEQWLEIVRVSKKGQSMRILRKLDDLIDFCLKAGFID